MTDKDKKLVSLAQSAHYTDWPEIYDLADKADTPEAAYEIKRIAMKLYHTEEYYAGML